MCFSIFLQCSQTESIRDTMEIRGQRFLKTLLIGLDNPVLAHSNICLKASSFSWEVNMSQRNMHIHVYCSWIMESVQVSIEIGEWIKKLGCIQNEVLFSYKIKKKQTSGHLLGKGIELKIISFVKLENREQQDHIFSSMYETHMDTNIHTHMT